MSCFEKCSNAGMNLELERKKEFERRKKLRLLQVRQQSKEFADQLRGRIRGEIVKQKTKYLEAENKLKQEEHLKELRHLKELYEKCLQSIGNGHKEASKQPDINLEKQTQLDRIVEQAAKRGTKAIKKQIEDKTIQKQTREAPVKQKKVIRNKENLRAFFISSLPKNSKKDDSISPPKTSHQNTETPQVRRVLEDIPSNINNGNSKVPEQSRKNVESVSVVKTVSKVGEKVQSREQGLPETVVTETKPADCTSVVSSPRDCSCDYIVCLCHQSPPDLRRSSSESRLSCDRVPVFDDPVKKKYRRRSSSPQSVRTLKYFGCGNVYESNQRSSVRVTHHSRSPKRTEEQAEEVKSSTVAEVPIEQSIEELKKRAEERSAKALKKEQLKKDFQQLINNLKKLSQEKSVISSKTKGKSRVFASERDIQSRNEKKQKKLNDAFEKLPHSLKSNKAQNSGTEKQKPNQVPSDESSPPTLNLALCQSNMSPPASRRVVSEISISDTSSAYSGGSKRMKKRAKSSSSSTRLRAESPEVLVKRDPSGDVHITVKVSEVLSRPKSKSPSPPSRRRHISPRSDSSYMSPPSNLTPSQQHLLNALLSQVNKRGIGDEMRKYIQKLLNMSRESIDNLHSQSRPQTPLNKDLEQDFAKLSQLAEVYAEKVNTLVDMYEQMGLPSPLSPGGYVDPIRAPPSEIQQRTPTPRSTRSASPTMRPMISPSVERFSTPSPTQRPKMTSPSPSSSGSANTADTMELMFGGIPGVQVPTREECEAMRAQRSCSPGSTLPLPDDWDMQAWFSEKRQQILQQGTDCDRNSYSPDKRVQTGLPKSPERSAPQNPFSPGQNKSPGFSGFTQDFGEFAQDDFNKDFTDMDFNMGIDAVLQEEARGDDYVEYPEDFPPPTDVFGPGFDWETANFDQPNFPRSFPGESLAGHSMSSAGSVKLDTSFDTSALQGPVNPDRLNAIRKKLSNICNDQYRNILEMLKEDASSHQLAYGNLLRRATSDPFLDPNATLAPIGSPGKSYSGSEYTVPRHVSSPGSTRSGFEATGRTPPADNPVSDYGSPDWSSSFPSYLSSDPNTRSGGLNSFDTSPQYCDFNDVYSNLDNLMLLMKNHQERQ
ncbi:serine/arginine repetitive matrix protein 1-like isoform X4 [Macrosteles quadrilineatus]|uniref:serine/arginine repetitive matrix protein 1-like isoform X4 n=1 Tax=Macrosteles quadrilineatus TaxID=74068 RepID=UPI0023E16F37|nr:serine/arginine repetitive matrix protein 1-like isoform X4 [Macrosteles quadrilineatus]